MRDVLMGALLFAALSSAQAQTLFRCGNNFSQTPCSGEAKTVYRCGGVASDKPCPTDAKIADLQTKSPSSDRIETMKEACMTWLRTVPEWKDRDSLKFGAVSRGKFDVKTLNGTPTVVVSYLTTINGKNSYGAYVGERVAVCYANEQETKILHALTFSS